MMKSPLSSKITPRQSADNELSSVLISFTATESPPIIGKSPKSLLGTVG